MKLVEKIKSNAKRLKSQVYVLYFVAQHPRTPWYSKIVVFAMVAYTLSPIDLIPDFVPVLGYLDDLIILPLGMALALRLVPRDILNECTKKVSEFKFLSTKNWKAGI